MKYHRIRFRLPAGQGVFSGANRSDVEKVVKSDRFNTAYENDPEGPKRDCRVLETYQNGLQNVVRLRFRVETGKEFEVRSSVGHRFYVRELGFEHADRIPLGSELVNHNGQTVELIDRELEPDPVLVYNFEVEGALDDDANGKIDDLAGVIGIGSDDVRRADIEVKLAFRTIIHGIGKLDKNEASFRMIAR